MKNNQKVRGHRDLEVWKESMNFVIMIYKITEDFPESEKYGLSQQLRRASVSVPSNIAEGAGRCHSKEFIQFLYFSMGSLSEIETQLIIGNRLGFFSSIEDHLGILIKIRKMTVGLIKSLKTSNLKLP